MERRGALGAATAQLSSEGAEWKRFVELLATRVAKRTAAASYERELEKRAGET